MANEKISFYRQASGATATGAVTFKTSGGITVGDGSNATEYASKVSVSRNLTSGTKIGTITINGTGTDLYCETNTNTDTKVTTATTASKFYLTGQTASTATTGTLVFRTNAYVDASGYLYSAGTQVSVEGHTHSDYASSSHSHAISSLINRTVTTTLTSSGEGGSTCTFSVPGIVLNCTGTSCSSLSYDVSTTSSTIATAVTGTRSGKAGQTVNAKIDVTYLPCG